MSAVTTPFPEAPSGLDSSLSRQGRDGLLSSLRSRRSSRSSSWPISSTLGKSLTGPTPREVLETPIFFTICLLSSSLTIHFAGKFLERGRQGAFLTSVAADNCSRRPLSVWHGAGMAPADLRTRTDDLHQSVWNNLLLAGWSARLSRHRRPDHALHRADLRFGWSCRRGAVAPRRRTFLVLAFCRCRLGRGFHRGLHSRTLRKEMATLRQHEQLERTP